MQIKDSKDFNCQVQINFRFYLILKDQIYFNYPLSKLNYYANYFALWIDFINYQLLY